MEVFRYNHLASQVFEETGKKLEGEEKRNTKMTWGQFLFQDLPHGSRRSASLEDWNPESSCSQVLILTGHRSSAQTQCQKSIGPTMPACQTLLSQTHALQVFGTEDSGK